MRALSSFLVCAALALLGACASAPAPRKVLLDFLDRPHVTREEVRARLGEPVATFESDHVLAYRLRRIEAGYGVPPPGLGWEGVTDEIILEFDDDGLLQKHSLVIVRTP